MNNLNKKKMLKHRYVHYTNGKEYTIKDTCKIQVDNEWVCAIIYEDEHGMRFVRSKAEFIEKFDKVKEKIK